MVLPRLCERPLAFDFSSTQEAVWMVSRNPAWHILSLDQAPMNSVVAHSREISCASTHPSRLWVTTGSDDGNARVWSTHDGTPQTELIPIQSTVRQAVLSADARRLCALTIDGQVQIWELPLRPSSLHPHPLNVPASGVFPSADGRFLTLPIPAETNAAVARSLRWYEFDTGTAFEQELDRPIRRDVLFARRGDSALVTGMDGQNRVFKSPQFTDGVDLPVALSQPVFSADGALLAGVSSNTVVLWSVGRRRLDPVLANRPAPAHLLFAANDASLVAADSATIAVLSLGGRGVREFIPGIPPESQSVAAAPRGNWLAWSGDEQVTVLNLQSGLRRGLSVPQTTRLRFSPDGKLLAVGDRAGLVRLWAVARWGPVGISMHHTQAVNGLDFSQDGESLVTSSADGCIRLWDARTGLAMASPEHSPGAWDVYFSRGDDYVLDATGVRWQLPGVARLSNQELLRAADFELGEFRPQVAEGDRGFLRWVLNRAWAKDLGTPTPQAAIPWREMQIRRASAAEDAPDSVALREAANMDPEDPVEWEKRIRFARLRKERAR